MDKFFNKAFLVLYRAADLVLLNVLWFVCSIPIITIGASTCALYTAVIRNWNDEDTTVLKDFFGSFRRSFRQGTLAWLIVLGISVVLYSDIDIMLNGFKGTSLSILWVPAALALVLLVAVSVYLFPLISRYDNSLKTSFKNALALVCGRPFYTFSLFLLTALCAVATYISLPRSLIVWILFGGSLLTSVNYRILRHIFHELEHPGEPEKTESEEEELPDDTEE